MPCICLQHCSMLVCYHGGAILGVFHVQKTLLCPSAFVLNPHIHIIRASHAIPSSTHHTAPSTEVSKTGTSLRLHFIVANSILPFLDNFVWVVFIHLRFPRKLVIHLNKLRAGAIQDDGSLRDCRLLIPFRSGHIHLEFTLPFHERFRQIRVMNVQFLWGVERIGHC